MCLNAACGRQVGAGRMYAPSASGEPWKPVLKVLRGSSGTATVTRTNRRMSLTAPEAGTVPGSRSSVRPCMWRRERQRLPQCPQPVGRCSGPGSRSGIRGGIPGLPHGSTRFSRAAAVSGEVRVAWTAARAAWRFRTRCAGPLADPDRPAWFPAARGRTGAGRRDLARPMVPEEGEGQSSIRRVAERPAPDRVTARVRIVATVLRQAGRLEAVPCPARPGAGVVPLVTTGLTNSSSLDPVAPRFSRPGVQTLSRPDA